MAFNIQYNNNAKYYHIIEKSSHEKNVKISILKEDVKS